MAVSDGPLPRRRIRWKPTTPAATLVLIAPLVGEVLNGATRLTSIFAVLPEVMVWGCGALVIREVVHRWRGGRPSVIFLGLSLSVIVEVLVLQTSVAPIPWLQMASIPFYDRIWGVNWLWFAFMLGYETVWIVLVPILTVELIFPGQRDAPWLRSRGLTIAAVVFTVGCSGLWVLWTQIAIPAAFHQPKYWPPRSTLLLGAAVAILLVMVGYAVRGRSERSAGAASSAPSPWIVGVTAAVLAVPWWILIVLIFVPQPSLPIWIPLASAPIWAAAAYVIITRWSAASSWSDRHRWVLAFSAVSICMLMGYLGSSLWPVIDLAFKIVVNVIAVAWMISLGRRVWRR
jgi:hypothetical protein